MAGKGVRKRKLRGKKIDLELSREVIKQLKKISKLTDVSINNILNVIIALEVSKLFIN